MDELIHCRVWGTKASDEWRIMCLLDGCNWRAFGKSETNMYLFMSQHLPKSHETIWTLAQLVGHIRGSNPSGLTWSIYMDYPNNYRMFDSRARARR